MITNIILTGVFNIKDRRYIYNLNKANTRQLLELKTRWLLCVKLSPLHPSSWAADSNHRWMESEDTFLN